MKIGWIAIALLLITLSGMAQQPLSKKDQARKAAFLAQIEAEKKYEELMVVADQAFKDKDYVKARMTYSEAIEYNQNNEQWLTSKVNDLDILMAKIVMREVDSITVIQTKTDVVVPTAEVATPEIAPRNEEMKIIPAAVEEAEPKKIEVEEVVLNSAPPVEGAEEKEAEKPKEQPSPKVEKEPAPKPKPIVSKPVIKESVKVKDDYTKYPQGRSDETFTFPDHTVRRIIVKDGIDTITYKYVTHRWGGKFYFKDDISIAERIWKEEVAAFEKKYPTNSKAAE